VKAFGLKPNLSVDALNLGRNHRAHGQSAEAGQYRNDPHRAYEHL